MSCLANDISVNSHCCALFSESMDPYTQFEFDLRINFVPMWLAPWLLACMFTDLLSVVLLRAISNELSELFSGFRV